MIKKKKIRHGRLMPDIWHLIIFFWFPPILSCLSKLPFPLTLISPSCITRMTFELPLIKPYLNNNNNNKNSTCYYTLSTHLHTRRYAHNLSSQECSTWVCKNGYLKRTVLGWVLNSDSVGIFRRLAGRECQTDEATTVNKPHNPATEIHPVCRHPSVTR